MAKLPEDTRLKTEKAIEDGRVRQEPRKYLGFSEIGKKCSREIWYNFRMVSHKYITRRQERLFQRGHREEPIIQADLRRIGIVCHVDQNNQPEAVCCDGHMKGHLDDILTNVPDAPKTPHLGEYKTHNDKSFKDVKKKGLATSKPVHLSQMFCYMDYFKLKRGLYVAVNKNDDERYYERVAENPAKAKQLVQKGKNIIQAVQPPERIGGPTWYECKWCDFYGVCHLEEQPLVNCRTCRYSRIETEGRWFCTGHKIFLSFGQQKIGCNRHKFLKGLIE